jgi:hypothetical protein
MTCIAACLAGKKALLFVTAVQADNIISLKKKYK